MIQLDSGNVRYCLNTSGKFFTAFNIAHCLHLLVFFKACLSLWIVLQSSQMGENKAFCQRNLESLEVTDNFFARLLKRWFLDMTITGFIKLYWYFYFNLSRLLNTFFLHCTLHSLYENSQAVKKAQTKKKETKNYFSNTYTKCTI